MSVVAEEQQTEAQASVIAPLTLPRVNLLPPGPAEQARFRRIQMGLGAGLVAVVGVVALLHAAASAAARDASAELQVAVDAGTALQLEVSGLSEVAAVHDQATQAQAVLTQAMQQEVRYSGLLHDLSRTVPADVWLESVSFSQVAPAAETGAAGASPAIGSVTFAGVALEHDDVATWLEALADQDGFASPTFTGATTGPLGERTAVTFTSTVSLTSAALSGRYAPEARG